MKSRSWLFDMLQASDTRRICAFRNRLIDGDASVWDEFVWGLLETSVPALRGQVDALLNKTDPYRGSRGTSRSILVNSDSEWAAIQRNVLRA